jgi:hypothetical protein
VKYGTVDARPRRPPAAAPAHTPTKTDTITAALRHAVTTKRDGLKTVTLVPVAITPRRTDRAITADLFHFDEMSLRTYLSATDNDLPDAG